MKAGGKFDRFAAGRVWPSIFLNDPDITGPKELTGVSIVSIVGLSEPNLSGAADLLLFSWLMKWMAADDADESTRFRVRARPGL
jgi:hypothetical protein